MAVQKLLFWNQTGESQLFGLEIIKEAERQVEIVRENLKTAQSSQKSYADPKRREVVFEVGDYAYLRVSPIQGLQRFNIRGKLSPRFIGPFQVLERRGEVAYRLELPERLVGVHDVFHVSQLKKCSSEIRVEHLPLEEHDVKDDLTYKECPVKILDTSERATRSKVIQRMRQLGKQRMSLKKNSLSCSLIFLNLGTRFSLRG
jgi:hypothetical protein